MKDFHFIVIHKATQQICYDWSIEAENYEAALIADDSVDIIKECKK